MLRMLSYALDLHWERLHHEQLLGTRAQAGPLHKKHSLSQIEGYSTHASPDDNMLMYIAYALYPPLYLAGPIMPFSDFRQQLLRPARTKMAGGLCSIQV